MNKTIRNILIRLTMLLGFCAFVFLLVVAKINRDETRVKHVKIGIDEWSGNFFINKKQIADLVEESFHVKNRLLSGRELSRIEKFIARIPQVKRANAYTDNQGNLNIKIEQRKPLLRVYNIQGQTFYVDNTGIKFSTCDHFTAKVPIVTGNISEVCDSTRKISSLALVRSYNVARLLVKDPLWSKMIGQYNINDNGMLEMVPRLGSSIVLFGDDKNVLQKIKNLDVFYFDVLKKIGWDYYKVINMMYKDQVVCLK